jgi:molybdenum cofactor biosynthesis protein B
MLRRAAAGLANETLLFAMPGSTNALTFALAKPLLSELPHLIWERRR